MGKKKRKRGEQSAPKKSPQFGNNPFQGLGKAAKKPRKVNPPKSSPRSPSATEDVIRQPETPKTAAELFEHALGLLDETSSIYDLKFGAGKTQTPLPPAADETPNALSDPAGQDTAPDDIVYQRAEWAFEQEMGALGIDRIEEGHLRVATRSRSSKEALANFEPERRSLQQESISPVDESEEASSTSAKLTHDQRRLLERVKRQEKRGERLPEVNLRGLTRGPALGMLETFLEKQSRAGVRLIRVVTGKGKQSMGAPVLKKDACDFLEGAAAPLVSFFVPEHARDGEFGSLIVQLKKI